MNRPPLRAAAKSANVKLNAVPSLSSSSAEGGDPSGLDQDEIDATVSDSPSSSTIDSDSDSSIELCPSQHCNIQKWTNDFAQESLPQPIAQTRLQNIVRVRQGPTTHVMHVCGRSPLEAFSVFCTSSIVRKIVIYTNTEGCRLCGSQWKMATDGEIQVFCGLLLLVGVDHAKNASILELWSEANGRPIFNQSMPRDRFIALRQCIRFDEKSTRVNKQLTDKFFP